MHVLVTGGCGFVGAAICRRLVAETGGTRVTALELEGEALGQP